MLIIVKPHLTLRLDEQHSPPNQIGAMLTLVGAGGQVE
jgi:hypothetical protein